LATRVFLLRHAESANPDVFHGAESDVGLSERGRRQAEAVAPLLAAEHPDLVVSSAMRRALDTASPAARACGLTVWVEPDLHERRVGALSGTPFRADGVWPQTLRRWMAGDTAYAPPGAESFDAIRDRVLPVWERLTETHAGRTVVIVAHGVVCKVLLLSVLPGLTPAAWERLGPFRNVAVSELAWGVTGWRGLVVNQVPPSVAAC
jgi:broad specificity phosphatase PhoE